MRFGASGREGAENTAIEAWLRQDFLRRYDDMLREPLPAELLALLETI